MHKDINTHTHTQCLNMYIIKDLTNLILNKRKLDKQEKPSHNLLPMPFPCKLAIGRNTPLESTHMEVNVNN